MSPLSGLYRFYIFFTYEHINAKALFFLVCTRPPEIKLSLKFRKVPLRFEETLTSGGLGHNKLERKSVFLQFCLHI